LGSRVPACPTRRSPISLLTVATAPKEVMPWGFLMFNIPSTVNLYAVRTALRGDLAKEL
jgi:hypothetical protein